MKSTLPHFGSVKQTRLFKDLKMYYKIYYYKYYKLYYKDRRWDDQW